MTAKKYHPYLSDPSHVEAIDDYVKKEIPPLAKSDIMNIYHDHIGVALTKLQAQLARGDFDVEARSAHHSNKKKISFQVNVTIYLYTPEEQYEAEQGRVRKSEARLAAQRRDK